MKNHELQNLGWGLHLVPLTQGKFAIISSDDADRVSAHRWIAAKCASPGSDIIYATTQMQGKTVYMHRLIMEPGAGLEVDHVNHDGLDNARDNLRVVTHRENMLNARKRKGCTSRYKGVCWVRDRGKWGAYARLHGKTVYLGLFPSEAGAARAYNAEAAKHYGPCARLNEVG